MNEIDIHELLDKDYPKLIKDIPENSIIVGEVDQIYIKKIYNKLDLSRVECRLIGYENQKYKSIKNHILPNSLDVLDIINNNVTHLPDILPNNLRVLYCSGNYLENLSNIKLPNSLEKFQCNGCICGKPDDDLSTDISKLILPNSLKDFSCDSNDLIKLPILPDSLEIFSCCYNKIDKLDLPINLKYLSFYQDESIEYLNYIPNLKRDPFPFKLIIKGYNNENPITNQNELDQYMNYIYRNKMKSARK